MQPDAIVPSNAYHALIILPEAEEQEFIDAQNEHAVDLAMAAIGYHGSNRQPNSG